MNPRLEKIWIIFGILCAIAGIITMFPYSAADKINLIGYKSVCPMAPVSSGTLFLLSGLVVYLRILIKKELSAGQSQIKSTIPQ